MYRKNPGEAQRPKHRAAAGKDGAEEQEQCSRESEQQDGSCLNRQGATDRKQLPNGQKLSGKEGKRQQDADAQRPRKQEKGNMGDAGDQHEQSRKGSSSNQDAGQQGFGGDGTCLKDRQAPMEEQLGEDAAGQASIPSSRLGCSSLRASGRL